MITPTHYTLQYINTEGRSFFMILFVSRYFQVWSREVLANMLEIQLGLILHDYALSFASKCYDAVHIFFHYSTKF